MIMVQKITRSLMCCVLFAMSVVLLLQQTS